MEYRRIDYGVDVLLESEVDPDPIAQFRTWLDQAVAAKLREPWAMTLATATSDAAPSARIVLLRGVDERGFVFFTNYDSRKGEEIANNPRAALVFFWAELERQVRIEGDIERTEAEVSDGYFHSRPEGSRLGAWASPQSRVIPDRKWLEQRVEEWTARFGGDTIPRPEVWGGYRVVPRVMEFWQGQPSRLHDRLRYRKDAGSRWIVERLAP